MTAIYRLTNLEDIKIETYNAQSHIDKYTSDYGWPPAQFTINPPRDNIKFNQLTKLKTIKFQVYDAKLGSTLDTSYC